MAKERHFIFQSELPVSREQAFAWHLHPGALHRMLPPWRIVQAPKHPPTPDAVGEKIHLKVRFGPFSFPFVIAYSDFHPGQEFSDQQVSGPFSSYRHLYRFISTGPSTCKLSDEITYATPCSLFYKKVESELARYFSWKHALLQADLMTYNAYPQEKLRILMSGTSGFIGSQLKRFLELAGHTVIRLVRSTHALGEDAIYWDPLYGKFQKQDFEGFDAVIHLAGAGIADQRWNRKRKEELFLSRCRDTWLLSQTLCRLYQAPKTLICASAVGFYGNRGDECLTEESAKGEGFLAGLCEKWEQSTSAIENRGTRVVHARFGAVLGTQGGMLKKLLPLYKLGLGGKMGSGDQYVSWIGIDDLLGCLYHILMTDTLAGPVNCTTSTPLPQKQFAHVLAHKLHRKAMCPVPAWALKGVLGQMGEEVMLASTRVFPEKLINSGYTFRHNTLEDALHNFC